MPSKQRVAVPNDLLIDVSEHELDMGAVEDERMGRFHRVIAKGMVEECNEDDYHEWKAYAHHPQLHFFYINDHLMTNPRYPDQYIQCDFCSMAIDGSIDVDSYRAFTYHHCDNCHTDYCGRCARHLNMDPRTDTSQIDNCLRNHTIQEKFVAMPQLRCKDCKSMLTRDIFCCPGTPEKDTLCHTCYNTKLTPEARSNYVRCKYTNEWDQLKIGSLLDWVPVVRFIDHDFSAVRYVCMNANPRAEKFGEFMVILIHLPASAGESDIATYAIEDIDAALRIMEKNRSILDYPVRSSFMSDNNVFQRNLTTIRRPHPDKLVHSKSVDHIRDMVMKLGHIVYPPHISYLSDTRL